MLPRLACLALFFSFVTDIPPPRHHHPPFPLPLLFFFFPTRPRTKLLCKASICGLPPWPASQSSPTKWRRRISHTAKRALKRDGRSEDSSSPPLLPSGHVASEGAPANPSRLSCHACVCLPTLSDATCIRRCAAYWCAGWMACRWPIQVGEDQLIARDSNKHHGIDWHTILHARSFLAGKSLFLIL